MISRIGFYGPMKGKPTLLELNIKPKMLFHHYTRCVLPHGYGPVVEGLGSRLESRSRYT